MATTSCPYITSANIGIDGGGFKLYNIQWQYTPLGVQTVLVQYKKQVDATWINVSTNEKIDIGGNLTTGDLEILASAEQNTLYEVRLVNQCGSLEYIQQFLFSYNIFSNSFLLDNALYNICGNDPVQLYSYEAFDTGVQMYTDVQLTTELSGYLFICLASGGSIYNLDSGTGVIGSETVYACRNSIAFKALLDNNTGTVCSQNQQTIYGDTSIQVGMFLFEDAAMSVALTGFDYAVFIGSEIIYNVNNATGEVTGINGTSCTAYNNLYYYSKVLSDIPNETPAKLYTVGSFGKGAIMYTDYGMTTALTGYNYISLNGVTRTISSTTGEVGCLATEC